MSISPIPELPRADCCEYIPYPCFVKGNKDKWMYKHFEKRGITLEPFGHPSQGFYSISKTEDYAA